MYYLSDYQTFDSVHELNHHVKLHTNKRYYDMNETQRQVLQLLSQYSVKHIGASHLKVETIAQAVNKSDRTIIRAINALVTLNVIEKLPTTRRISGGQGANIYRILPYVVSPEMSEREISAEPTRASDTTPIVEKETANLLSYKAITSNTSVANASDSIVNEPYKRRNTPYNTFKQAIHTFLGDSIHNANKSLLHRLYGVYLAQTKALRKAYDSNELIELASEAIRITFTTTKRKKLRNIPGYYNGVLSNMLDDMYIELIAEL